MQGIKALAYISYISGFNGETHPDLGKKLIPREELELTGDFLRRRNLRIAFTSGTYDMIHIGHGRYLQLAKSLGDVLVVGLNSDVSVRSYKGPSRPILSEQVRGEMLAFLQPVDYIILYDEQTAAEVIRLLKPDAYLCVEGSWPEGTDLKDKPEVVAMIQHEGKTFCAPRQEPHLSTSTIIERIEDAAIARILAKIDGVMRGRGIDMSQELEKIGEQTSREVLRALKELLRPLEVKAHGRNGH